MYIYIYIISISALYKGLSVLKKTYMSRTMCELCANYVVIDVLLPWYWDIDPCCVKDYVVIDVLVYDVMIYSIIIHVQFGNVISLKVHDDNKHLSKYTTIIINHES